MRYAIAATAICACALLAPTPIATAQTSGTENPEYEWELRGTRWKFSNSDVSLEGILVKPPGEGPFPALILSHGLGGSAAGLLGRAETFAHAGFVCIATDYTHAGRGKMRQASNGASPENIGRAMRCLQILKGLDYVHEERIGAWGFSMGALVTIGLAAQASDELCAVAISAGGIREGSTSPYPSVDTATKIKTPLCIVHGSDDERVEVESSKLLAETLSESGTRCERHVFGGVSHVEILGHMEANQKILDWLTQAAGLEPARFALKGDGGPGQRPRGRPARPSAGSQRRPPFAFEQFANRHDANRDTKVTRAEFTGQARFFSHLDANGDDVITAADFDASIRQPTAQTGAASSWNPIPNGSTPTDRHHHPRHTRRFPVGRSTVTSVTSSIYRRVMRRTLKIGIP